MRPLEVRLLGPLEIVAGGREVPRLTRKGRALLAYLAAQGRPATRGELAGLFWDAPEADARRNLRQTLYRLKKTAVAPYLGTAGDRVTLEPVRTDLARFQAHLSQGRIDAALALVRGGFLEDTALDDAPGFEDWRYLERERVKEAVIAALLARAEREKAEDPRRAAATLHEVLTWDPLLESAYQRLFALLADLGDRDAIERLYHRLKAELKGQLGLPPSAETERQYRAALLGIARAPEASPAPKSLDRPPLVEREAELETLAGMRAPLRLVVGPRGVGKTRLVETYAERQGGYWPIRHAASLAELEFGALTEALRDRDPSRLPEPLTAELARLLPELGPPPPVPLAQADARMRFFEALAQTFRHLGPVVVLDDLDRADPGFLAFLPYLLRRAPDLGLTLLATAEAPLLPELVEEGRVALLALGPLSREGVARLVQELSGHPGGRRFAARLHQATGGNPLFVLETLKDLFQSGELRQGVDGWATPYDATTLDYLELRLPRSVQEALLRRIHELGPEAARVTRLLLLARTPADPETVARALGLSQEAAAAALLEAAEAGLLVPTPRGFWPRHPELADRLPQALAQSLHRLWAKALAELGGPPQLVAEHLAAGGRSPEAGAYALKAARAARKGAAPAAAVVLYKRAGKYLPLRPEERYALEVERLGLEAELGRDVLAALEELGEPPRPNPRLEARRRLAAAEAALKKGLFERAREHAEAALVAGTDDPALTGRARYLLAWVEYRAGDPWAQQNQLRAALDAFERAGDRRGACQARRNLAALAFRLGRAEEGEALQRQILATLEAHPDPTIHRRVWADRLTGRWLHRDFAAALEGATQLLKEARQSADLPAQLDALELIGLAEWKIGRFSNALEALEEGLGLARAIGSRRETALLASERALPLVELGAYREAEQALTEAKEAMEALGDQAKLGHVLTGLGYLELRRGRPQAAVPWLIEAGRHWEARGELGHAARALALLALARPDPEAAETAWRYAEGWRTGVPERVLIAAVRARYRRETAEKARALFEEEHRRLPKALRPYHRRTFPARLVTAL